MQASRLVVLLSLSSVWFKNQPGIQSTMRSTVQSLVLMLLLALASSCASTGDGDSTSSGTRGGGFSSVQACKASDLAIKTSASCLSGDAACYQIADGSWCTGERGSLCPTGSTALTAGQTCPRGSRCFSISNELSCVISLN